MSFYRRLDSLRHAFRPLFTSTKGVAVRYIFGMLRARRRIGAPWRLGNPAVHHH